MLCNKRSHRNEKPATTESLCTATRESPCIATKTYIQGLPWIYVSVFQWLRLQAPSAGSQGSIPGQGTRFHMSLLRVYVSQLKIPRAATKIWHSQRNKQIHIFFKKYISSHGTPPAENPSAVPALLRIRSESQQGTHRMALPAFFSYFICVFLTHCFSPIPTTSAPSRPQSFCSHCLLSPPPTLS